jgi:hypothetical protein
LPHPIPSSDQNGPRVYVQFFVPETPFESDLDANATKEQGRPIYKQNEYVRVTMPGDPLNKPVCLAHEKRFFDRRSGQRVSYADAFAEEYRMFKAGLAEQIVGTPLTELPAINSAKRAELKALAIHTVEALASLDGQNLKRLGMEGNSLKSLATAYLEKAKGSAMDAKFAAENAALKAQIEELQKAVKQIAAGKADDAMEDNSVNPPPPALFDDFSDDDLKTYIKTRTGETPRGRVSRETLLRSAHELHSAEMEAA